MEDVLSTGYQRVMECRSAVTNKFLVGSGVEIGAGSRPFPVPSRVNVLYGDIRDTPKLVEYFGTNLIKGGENIFDAQTMSNFRANSLDFVLSGHVIEHLWNPVGSIVNSIKSIKTGGYLILAVPDMRMTFDRNRPVTSLKHLLADYEDDGVGTVKQAYIEHLKYVHPILTNGEHYDDAEIERQAEICSKRPWDFDLHVHAWTLQTFSSMLDSIRDIAAFSVELAIPIENENIFVIRKK